MTRLNIRMMELTEKYVKGGNTFLDSVDKAREDLGYLFDKEKEKMIERNDERWLEMKMKEFQKKMKKLSMEQRKEKMLELVQILDIQ